MRDLFEQIDMAIQVHDKLLLVLSENSMMSNWVEREIKKAFKTADREKRKKLFPIRFVSYEVLLQREVNDGDTGKDLVAEIRKFYIPTDPTARTMICREFKKLLMDLPTESQIILTTGMVINLERVRKALLAKGCQLHKERAVITSMEIRWICMAAALYCRFATTYIFNNSSGACN